MQKWAGMLVETGEAFVDPSAVMTQMREDSDFWSLSPLTILCWRTHLVITKHPEYRLLRATTIHLQPLLRATTLYIKIFDFSNLAVMYVTRCQK